MFSFLRYAAADVLRNRRRTVAAIIGVVLTVTFISGSFIAIDSSTRATLDAYLANVPGDFSYYGSTGNASAVRGAVAGVPGVTEASVYQYLSVSEIGSAAAVYSFNMSIVGIDPDHRPILLRDVTVSGSLALPRGAIGLPVEAARSLNVAIGDTVYLAYRSYNASENRDEVTRLNLTVGALLTGVAPVYYSPYPYFATPSVVHVRDVDWIETQLKVQYRYNSLQGEIWIDRDRFIDPYNLEVSQRNLGRLQRQIDLALAPFGGSSSSNLLYALQNLQFTLAFQRLIYFILSGPVIFLGLYLGAIGVDLGHAERRRELGIFQTRGATRRQVLGLLVLEAIVGGVVAGILGLFAGIAMSRLLLGVTILGASIPGAGAAPSTEFLLSPETIITTIFLGTVFMLLASVRSARRTARLAPVETLRYYAPGETKIDYKPTLDIILIALAVTTIGVSFWINSGAANIFLFLLGGLFFILIPLAPVFLIIGLTRIATRSSGRVYEWASRAIRPLAKNLYHVISRNVARNPRRSSNVCVIIALGIAFGLLTLTLFASQQAWDVGRLRASIGADLAASASPSDPGFAQNATAVAGVTGVTPLLQLASVYPSYGFAAVWTVDPSTLFAVSQPEPWYFLDGGAAAAADVLATSGQVIITKVYADQAFLAVGDTLLLRGDRFNETTGMPETTTVTVTVGGLVRSLPGVNEFAYSPPPAVFGSPATFATFVSDSSRATFVYEARYLASLTPGADWRSVKENVTALGGYNVRLYAEQLQQLRADPIQQAVFGFLAVEIAFAALILTVGLALVTFAAVFERKVEFAGIVARGASGRQASALLVGESTSILIIGLTVGVAVGLLASWIMAQVFLVGPPGQSETLVPFSLVVPPSAVVFIVAAPLAMVAAVLLVAWRIVRMDVARALRVRGG